VKNAVKKGNDRRPTSKRKRSGDKPLQSVGTGGKLEKGRTPLEDIRAREGTKITAEKKGQRRAAVRTQQIGAGRRYAHRRKRETASIRKARTRETGRRKKAGGKSAGDYRINAKGRRYWIVSTR